MCRTQYEADPYVRISLYVRVRDERTCIYYGRRNLQLALWQPHFWSGRAWIFFYVRQGLHQMVTESRRLSESLWTSLHAFIEARPNFALRRSASHPSSIHHSERIFLRFRIYYRMMLFRIIMQLPCSFCFCVSRTMNARRERDRMGLLQPRSRGSAAAL
ncbi:hypothetical protein SISSUDRAFT_704883 [Sistotremastrum suecicum HHB10207 ss-3]|uniref:Uncharacterized protein n=1 Tax=Sistotremastrum suecicum HHB10207 ss-3 TaxID=1314776 RepID=A0A166DT48_9AGAM|nr:hypothetical protein SISSUDRAFT_704883 [Sistotremastrum suecicum HHB10207 ss-3]